MVLQKKGVDILSLVYPMIKGLWGGIPLITVIQ